MKISIATVFSLWINDKNKKAFATELNKELNFQLKNKTNNEIKNNCMHRRYLLFI